MERALLEVGAEASVIWRVAEADLVSAIAVGLPDAFPAVFATARMIALMEVAAARVLRPLLAAGELSVGVTVDVAHSAATPLGATVQTRARFVRQEGKVYVFEVWAEDEGGEIGRGLHKRAIVATERPLNGAARRCPEK
ncbi:MAG: thioesterase [Acidobacteria bacterium]|nr:thioesterase [Acidobacteriota bacterium]MBI3425159.1 thioesterase [Acidobacteriota bacterium]